MHWNLIQRMLNLEYVIFLQMTSMQTETFWSNHQKFFFMLALKKPVLIILYYHLSENLFVCFCILLSPQFFLLWQSITKNSLVILAFNVC